MPVDNAKLQHLKANKGVLVIVKWTCPKCGASSEIEAQDDPELTVDAIQRIHALLTPECVNASPYVPDR